MSLRKAIPYLYLLIAVKQAEAVLPLSVITEMHAEPFQGWEQFHFRLDQQPSQDTSRKQTILE
jgi:hypothetical protein